MAMARRRGGHLRARAWAGALVSAAAIVAALVPGSVSAATSQGTAGNGELYFTTFQNQGNCGTSCTPNVFSVSWAYNGNGASGFTVGPKVTVATTTGADGIVFDPSNGNLLIGGQATGKVYEVNPTTHAVDGQATTGTGNSYHLTLGTNGQMVWSFGGAGDNTKTNSASSLALPLQPAASNQTGQVATITGDDSGITQMAYVKSLDKWFYTDSGDTGPGDFGYAVPTVTGGVVTKWTTHRLAANVAYAHGIVYDPYTGDLLLVGNNVIEQVVPSTGQSNSSMTFTQKDSSGNVPIFDQVAVDGAGHVFVSDNLGDLYFFDYSKTGAGDFNSHTLTGSFVANKFLASQLDDIVNDLPEVPLAIALPAIMGLAILMVRRRRLRIRAAVG